MPASDRNTPRSSRRATEFGKVEVIYEHARMIQYMAYGLPPKILVYHYSFSPKLIAKYWHQVNGAKSPKGAIPGPGKLFSSRRKQLQAALFLAVYLSQECSPTKWRSEACLDAVVRSHRIVSDMGIDYSIVDGWSLVRLHLTNQLRESVCRHCNLFFCTGRDCFHPRCPHCAYTHRYQPARPIKRRVIDVASAHNTIVTAQGHLIGTLTPTTQLRSAVGDRAG